MKILAIGDFQGVFPTKLKKKISKKEFDLVIGIGDYAGIKEGYPYVRDMFKRSKSGKERISPEEFFGKEKLKKLEKKDFEAGKKILSELNKMKEPVIAIFGNTDDGWYEYPGSKMKWAEKKKLRYLKRLKNMRFITYAKKKIRGITFVGFGGYMDIAAYFRKNTFPEEKQHIPARKKRHAKIRKKLFDLLKEAYRKKGNKAFVFHYPPKGIFDIIKDKKNPMDKESAGIDFFREAIKKYKPTFVLCGHMAEYEGMKKLYGVPIINPGAAHEGRAVIIEIDKGKIKKIKFIK